MPLCWKGLWQFYLLTVLEISMEYWMRWKDNRLLTSTHTHNVLPSVHVGHAGNNHIVPWLPTPWLCQVTHLALSCNTDQHYHYCVTNKTEKYITDVNWLFNIRSSSGFVMCENQIHFSAFYVVPASPSFSSLVYKHARFKKPLPLGMDDPCLDT